MTRGSRSRRHLPAEVTAQINRTAFAEAQAHYPACQHDLQALAWDLMECGNTLTGVVERLEERRRNAGSGTSQHPR